MNACNAGRPSSTPSSSTDHMETNGGVGTWQSSLWWWSWHQIACTDNCTTPTWHTWVWRDFLLNWLSGIEHTIVIWRENVERRTARLTYENCQLKEKLASEEITLESLKDLENTVRYFTDLTDFMTLAEIYDFVSTHIPYNKRRALFPGQALVLTFMHIRVNTPPSATSCMYSASHLSRPRLSWVLG